MRSRFLACSVCLSECLSVSVLESFLFPDTNCPSTKAVSSTVSRLPAQFIIIIIIIIIMIIMN